jgi:transposase
MEHIGLDLHKQSSHFCILTEDRKLLELRIRTEHGRFVELLGKRPKAKVLIEASTESEWVARLIEQLGHEVVVADLNFAPMVATRNRKIKTDKRDARALCDACRLGAYRPAHRSSDNSRDLRAQVMVRDALVKTRTKYISLIRSIVRREGYRVPNCGVVVFAKRVEELALPQNLSFEIEPLLKVMTAIKEPISTAKYRRYRNHGISHGAALRRIGDSLLKVACAMLKSGTLYDPTQRKGYQPLASDI